MTRPAPAAGAADALRHPRLAMFDLDGTLIDTVPDIAFCTDRMLERLGMPPCGEARVRRWIGNGIERLVRRALSGELDGECSDALFAQALPLYLSLYAVHCADRSQRYPGAVEALESLRSAGVAQACITNKAAQFTAPLLETFGLAQYFSLVISGDTLPKRKPDPLPIEHALHHYGLSPGEALLIGDSSNDVAAARAAGSPVICVSYGYNHGRDIRDAAPDAVIDSLAELPELLASTQPVQR